MAVKKVRGGRCVRGWPRTDDYATVARRSIADRPRIDASRAIPRVLASPRARHNAVKSIFLPFFFLVFLFAGSVDRAAARARSRLFSSTFSCHATPVHCMAPAVWPERRQRAAFGNTLATGRWRAAEC